jgi:hypothetical protein
MRARCWYVWLLTMLAVPLTSVTCGGVTTGNPSATRPTALASAEMQVSPASSPRPTEGGSAAPGTLEATPSPGAPDATSVVPAASPVALMSLPNLTFELTGGFQGLARRLTISSAGQAIFEDYRTQRRAEQWLSSQEIAQLEGLLESSAFFSQSESQSRPCADCYNYRISVESQDRSHSVEANDLGVDPQLAGLVAWLTGFLEMGLDQ